MLVSQKIIDSINTQIGNEFGASMQYIAIAAHFDAESLPRLAKHFYKQAAEEQQHGMRFLNYIIDVGGRVVIPAITQPKSTFKFAEEAVKLSLEWEIEVTRQINGIMDLALKENDHLTSTFLQWFLKEQVEEVSSMDQLLKIVQRTGESGLIHVEQYISESNIGGHGADESEAEKD